MIVDFSGEINRSSPIPFYYQLQGILQKWIEESGLPPQTLLPSEAELCEKYQVSRTVVRAALSALQRDGLIYRVKGRGSFISQPKLQQKITLLTSFTEDMRRQGIRPGGHVLCQEIVLANEMVAQRLGIPIKTPIYYMERVRFAEGEPIGIETVYLHFQGCDRLVNENLENRSLYETLSAEYHIGIQKADLELEATLVRPPETELLNVQTCSPAMLLRRTAYDINLQPFEYTKCIYRGDKYRFVSSLQK
jgi:GntR family transcriptional regulator